MKLSHGVRRSTSRNADAPLSEAAWPAIPSFASHTRMLFLPLSSFSLSLDCVLNFLFAIRSLSEIICSNYKLYVSSFVVCFSILSFVCLHYHLLLSAICNRADRTYLDRAVPKARIDGQNSSGYCGEQDVLSFLSPKPQIARSTWDG